MPTFPHYDKMALGPSLRAHPCPSAHHPPPPSRSTSTMYVFRPFRAMNPSNFCQSTRPGGLVSGKADNGGPGLNGAALPGGGSLPDGSSAGTLPKLNLDVPCSDKRGSERALSKLPQVVNDSANQAARKYQNLGMRGDNSRYGLHCMSSIPNHKTTMSTGLTTSKMTNQQLQVMAVTPTPSEVSSINIAPNDQPNKADDQFLQPGQVFKTESWNSYKVLPNVSSSNSTAEMTESHFMDSHPLSPFTFPEMSSGGSSTNSPRHSARLSKKRAFSVSPLSDGYMDFNALIRLSPTSLCPNILGARGSVNASPVQGSVGHLSARCSGNSPNATQLNSGTSSRMSHYSQSNFKKEDFSQSQPLNAPDVPSDPYYMNYLNASALDQQNNGDLMNNHLVVPQQLNLPFMENMYGENKHSSPHSMADINRSGGDGHFKQEPKMEIQNDESLQGQLPPTNMQNSIQDSTSFEASMPPPPPYPGDANRLYEMDSSENSPDSKNGEEGELKRVCKWIDCNQVFGEQEELVKHIEKHHIDQRKGEDLYTCFWSGCMRRYKPFNARYKLLIHMRVHSGERPNKCTFEGCSKAFSRLENLKIHLRSHTGERPYLCPHPGCSKAFSNSSDRAKHQRTHKDTKPYACTVPGCTKRYTDPSSLRKHVKNHTTKADQVRKRLHAGKDDEFGDGSEFFTCIPLHHPGRRDGGMTPQSDMYSGHQFGMHPGITGPLGGRMGMPSPGVAPLDEFDRRTAGMGGGFNPGPNGAILTPRRAMSLRGGVLPSDMSLGGIQGTKPVGMRTNMGPPPPYQTDTQYPQQNGGENQVAEVGMEVQVSMSMVPGMQPHQQQQQHPHHTGMPSGEAYLPPSSPYQHRPAHHMNYLPHEGNPNSVSDYMPCNMQERMTMSHNQHNYYQGPNTSSLEETLAYLPYDSVSFQKNVPSSAGN